MEMEGARGVRRRGRREGQRRGRQEGEGECRALSREGEGRLWEMLCGGKGST